MSAFRAVAPARFHFQDVDKLSPARGRCRCRSLTGPGPRRRRMHRGLAHQIDPGFGAGLCLDGPVPAHGFYLTKRGLFVGEQRRRQGVAPSIKRASVGKCDGYSQHVEGRLELPAATQLGLRLKPYLVPPIESPTNTVPKRFVSGWGAAGKRSRNRFNNSAPSSSVRTRAMTWLPRNQGSFWIRSYA